jgi:hypothetical protein
MASLKFQKSALTVSFSAALLSLSVATQAQSTNDFGELLIEGQISQATCVLSLGDPQSTGANKKTMNLGSYQASVASSLAAGTVFGTAQTTVLALRNSAGDLCALVSPASFKWDVGINISASNYETPAADVTVLKSTAASGIAAKGVGVRLFTSKNATTGTTALNLGINSTVNYGKLLNPNATEPTLENSETIAVTAQMARTTGPVTAGVFTHSIPLNVWYK